MKITGESKNWYQSKIGEFWGNIASQHNVFHVYEDEKNFIELLAGFVGTGVNAGESNIVIATSKHLEKLRFSLISHGLHVDSLIENEMYFPVNADYLLQKFMINELPDEKLFFNCIDNVFKVAKKRGRKLRAYREMVSILRANGNESGTRQLEVFWNRFNQIQHTLIFCAYPQKHIVEDECKSLKEIGFLKSKIVRNTSSPRFILYNNCSSN